MSYGKEPSGRTPEPESTSGGAFGAVFGRLKTHLVEWPDRCVETQVEAMDRRR